MLVLSASFEDMATFYGIQLSYDKGGGALSALYRSIDEFVKNAIICPYLHNHHLEFFFFNTVHNLITFSIVFTNKNWGALSAPPPHIITKIFFL